MPIRNQIRALFMSWNFQSLAAALVCTCLVFPDVIFMGASLRLTDQINGFFYGLPVKLFYPREAHWHWWDGYNDSGGATYQSEPMMEFMMHSLQKGESPYWNPYSAAGSLGPETLVDNKFSFLTLAYAALGGGSRVYNFLLILLYFWASYFTYRLAREKLKVSVIAATAATLFYLLNGYSISNTGSNVTQGYLYVPLCLYMSIAFIERPTSLRIAALILSFAVLFTCTFLPTLLTSLIGLYSVLLGYGMVLYYQRHITLIDFFKLFAAQVFCVFASILLLGFLYFPIIENIGSTGALALYVRRPFYPATWFGIPSLFSSSHFFESYNAMEQGIIQRINLGKHTNIVYHFSFTGLSLAICSISMRRRHFQPLVLVSGVPIMIGLGRIFDVPGISFLISKIPIVGNLGSQYWWPVIVIPMIFLVALGVDNLQHRLAIGLLPFLLLGILIMSLAAVGFAYGFREPNLGYKEWSVSLLIVTAIISSLAMFAVAYTSNRSLCNYVILALVLLMFTELTMDGKMIRYEVNDSFRDASPEVDFVKENIGLYRSMTIGNYVGVRPELGSVFGIQEITSLNQGTLPAYLKYFYAAISLDNDQKFSANSFPNLLTMQDTPDENTIKWRVINLLGVKYIIIPRSFTAYQQTFINKGLKPVFATPAVIVFENSNYLPRAFSISVDETDGGDTIYLKPGFRFKNQSVKITLYQNAVIHLEGKTDGPGLVILTDNWHKGWNATMNGMPAPIIRVDETFRGIRVPGGGFSIEMRYQPRTLLLAIACSFTILLVIVTLSVAHRKVDQYLAKSLPGLLSASTSLAAG